jgi:aspartate carbamoyltransferase regulatory subunit
MTICEQQNVAGKQKYNLSFANDDFDVISKCSNEDCETHKEKERFDPFMSILHQEKRKLLDDLMNGVED